MSSVRLRPATVVDHELYRHFFAELGTPDAPLDSARWQAECVSTSAFLMEEAREVGYAAWEQAGLNAHVRHVAIELTARGRGLGHRLMLELGARLRAGGAQAWRLNVYPTNAAAIGLYEKVGLSVVYATTVLRLDWEHVSRLACETSRSSEANPSFDSVLEKKFGLMEDQLGRARLRQGIRVVAATTPEGEPVGIAIFDPSLPGAFPFRCKSPGHARGLIEGLRERYHGDKASVQLVIEDSPAVAHTLQAAGAQRVRELFHMRGPIPR